MRGNNYEIERQRIEDEIIERIDAPQVRLHRHRKPHPLCTIAEYLIVKQGLRAIAPLLDGVQEPT